MHPHVFKESYSIGFVIRNQSFRHLNSWIYSNYQILTTKYVTHYLCVYQINFYIVIYIIKTPTSRSFAMWFLDFPLSMQFFQISLHYFFTAIFWILICLYLDTWIFLIPIFQNYIIHTYFNCFIIPSYHILICRKLFH
jgi:hypothetical protein